MKHNSRRKFAGTPAPTTFRVGQRVHVTYVDDKPSIATEPTGQSLVGRIQGCELQSARWMWTVALERAPITVWVAD